jgi:hypothetical protein
MRPRRTRRRIACLGSFATREQRLVMSPLGGFQTSILPTAFEERPLICFERERQTPISASSFAMTGNQPRRVRYLNLHLGMSLGPNDRAG